MAKKKTDLTGAAAKAAGVEATDFVAAIKEAARAAAPVVAAPIADQSTLGAPVPAGHVQIRFVKDYVVDDARRGTSREQSFGVGETVDLPERSARHFVSRGVAEYVVV